MSYSGLEVLDSIDQDSVFTTQQRNKIIRIILFLCCVVNTESWSILCSIFSENMGRVEEMLCSCFGLLEGASGSVKGNRGDGCFFFH